MKRMLLLAFVVLISFASFSAGAFAWWDSDYGFRYAINTTTDVAAFAVNNTFGLNGKMIWVYSGNNSFVYSKAANYGGTFAIATTTTQQKWENETSGDGNNVAGLWQSVTAVQVFHLGEGSGTAVRDSLTTNNATILGGTSTWVNKAVFGKGLNLGGGSRLNSSLPSELVGNKAFTISMWISGTAFASPTQWFAMLGTPSSNGAIIFGYDNNQILLGHYAQNVFTNIALNNNSWYHLAYSYNGTGYTLYVNNSKTTYASTATPNVVNDRTSIGGQLQDMQYLSGQIDEVEIFNSTLNDNDISLLFQNGADKLTSLGPEENNGGEGVPQYSNIVISPASPQSYDAGYIQFNVTWTSAAVNKSWIEYNFTGVTTRQFASNQSNVFRFNFTSPAAGNYSYQFFANNSAGGTNSTSASIYAVTRASTTLNLTLNGTNGDVTYMWPVFTNATGWKTVKNGNLTLYRNGTIVNTTTTINITSIIANLTSNQHNYTLILDHQNYTADFIQRILTLSKPDAQISLTSSGSWSINEDTSNTISCSSPVGSVTLRRDSLLVANPYAATYSSGFYTFECSIADTENYSQPIVSNVLNVLAGGVGCIDTYSYAYKTTVSNSGSQIVLNFTSLVTQNIVRDDMNDILLNTTNATLFKNTTGGSYVLMNSTNTTNFTLYFGNYYQNNSLVMANRTNNTITDFNYSQFSSTIYTVNLVDEMLGVRSLPTGANSSMFIYCSGGSTLFNITHNKFILATSKQLAQMEYIARYSPTEIYYRDLLVSNPVESKNMYVADANIYQVVQYLIQLQDNTLGFANPVLHIKKLIGNQLSTITERAFDAENKAIAYLINGQQYQISVTSGSSERIIGNLYADNVNLVKTITINNNVSTNSSGGNTTFLLAYNNQTGLITFNWVDISGNTNQTEMWVYNYTNQSQLLFYGNSTNTTSVEFNYIVPSLNNSYLTKVSIRNSLFGVSSFTLVTVLSAAGALPFAILPIIDAAALRFVSAFFLFTVPMYFGAVHGGTGAIIVAVLGILLAFIGFYPVGMVVLVVALVLALLSKSTEKKVET